MYAYNFLKGALWIDILEREQIIGGDFLFASVGHRWFSAVGNHIKETRKENREEKKNSAFVNDRSVSLQPARYINRPVV